MAGGHQVELARADHLLGAEAVAVQEFAGQQPGDGLQADVGVRADVEAVVLGDRGGAHVVDEAPGADRAAGAAGERSADREDADLGARLSVISRSHASASVVVISAGTSAVEIGPLMNLVLVDPPTQVNERATAAGAQPRQ